jgi:hypothetical protein
VRQKKLPLARPLETSGTMFFRRESLDKLLALTEELPDEMRHKEPKVLKVAGKE